MAEDRETTGSSSSARSAQWVAAGIFLSRIAGLVRESFLGRYLGTSYAADSFRTALRMPNVLQNLLGEGTLSASFIPVYAELLEEGREEEAGRVAGAIFALLFALAGALALLGIFFAPVLVSVFTPGFADDARYDLTVRLIRIIFPMAGVLVLSAWSLGILNSHRRFFIPYVAPVIWNAAMIGALLIYGNRRDAADLAVILGWAALLGGVLQFAIQLPWVIRLTKSLRIRWDLKLAGVRTAVRNAGPAVAGRGVVQLSGYVDMFLASMLAIGAVATLSYAQQLYILPISLFGMSVAAAELPELARRRQGAMDVLQGRVNAGLDQMAFYVVPSILGFIVLGDVLVAALYERGEFSEAATIVTWSILAVYSIGLLASTGTRIFSSAFFALHDTRTPAKIAGLRVALSAALGLALMVQFGEMSFEGTELLGLTIPAFSMGPYGFGFWDVPRVGGETLGPVGLAGAAGIAAWLEWWLLRRRLSERLGPVHPTWAAVGRMILAGLAAAAAARATVWAMPDLEAILPTWGNVLLAVAAVGVFGIVYYGLGAVLGLREAKRGVGRVSRLLGRGS